MKRISVRRRLKVRLAASLHGAWASLGLLACLWVVACGGAAATGAHGKGTDTPASADASKETEDPATRLPRYFTMELLGSETHIDGALLRGHDLSARIDQEANDARNDGAVVRLSEDFSGEILGALVWELSTAGFAHIIVSKKGMPLGSPETAPVAVKATEPPPASPLPAEVASEPAKPEAPQPSVEEPAPADVPADSSLRTIGLHVGGGPNDDATRNKFIAPIERSFEAMLSCHTLAKNRDRNASVGVDLLLSPQGGKAKLQDLRTALGGDEFQDCIRKAFGEISFPKVVRPTIVSYSMLFEPKGSR